MWLDYGLIINHESIQTQCVQHAEGKGSAVVRCERGERGHMRGKRWGLRTD